MKKFIFTTTGLVSTVKFEEIGAYFDHPTSAYTLTDSFEIEEIVVAYSIQDSLDNGEITAVDGNGNDITNIQYLLGTVPVVDVDDIEKNISLIGYGELTACKISKIITTGTSYNTLYANGNENFDKIWANRLSYTYF